MSKRHAGRTRPASAQTDIRLEVAAHEREANAAGRAHWDLYSEHRAQVTRLIVSRSAAVKDARVALLGAGNCNDVDLQQILPHVAQVHLVDIDMQAINGARARLNETQRAQVKLHAPVDLSGLLATWQQARPLLPAFAEVDAWAAQGATSVAAAVPEFFDLVVSCCVLTQMSWGLRQSLGPDHPLQMQAREALVAAHLRSLAALAPTGKALLVSDMISTEYHPLDDLPAGTNLQALMDRLVAEQNFYQGANPPLVRRLLRRDPWLAPRVKQQTWLPPWLWHGPQDRTYLVYALELTFA
ncbi:MAG: hypothetical protein SF187_00445 [Deltaproteobacteria bacterium]|nr:hypothetical protein [Deltaproteobacteria bacterium]